MPLASHACALTCGRPATTPSLAASAAAAGPPPSWSLLPSPAATAAGAAAAGPSGGSGAMGAVESAAAGGPPGQFVSAVAWSGDGEHLIAANSVGIVNVLSLA